MPSSLPFHAIVRRSPAERDAWRAHCLDLDSIAYGRSAAEAFEALCEAVLPVYATLSADGAPPMNGAAPGAWCELLGALRGADGAAVDTSLRAGEDAEAVVVVGKAIEGRLDVGAVWAIGDPARRAAA